MHDAGRKGRSDRSSIQLPAFEKVSEASKTILGFQSHLKFHFLIYRYTYLYKKNRKECVNFCYRYDINFYQYIKGNGTHEILIKVIFKGLKNLQS